jgi:hypothetical protein
MSSPSTWAADAGGFMGGASDPWVRPNSAAVRIDPADAPIIDGSLSDPVWARARVIDSFRQKLPTVGAAATERTEVRVLYDENNLYVSVYSFDSVPQDIVMRGMERDGPLFLGDAVSVRLDPGQTRRNGYRFMIGSSGGRSDTLLLNNSGSLDEWDPIWEGRAALVEDGWIAEYAIPFRILAYESGESDWGFDIRRVIGRKNEEIYWSAFNPNFNFTDVTQFGTLTGINDTSTGIGLDVQLYGAARVKRDWHIEGEDTGISFTGGGNAFYRLTPSLTGTLTFNPDFSDAPLDARQVNTTRFSLFFPETREFFLQDAGSFEFGGRGFARNFGERSANNGRPFFSRNLGLVNGQPLSIIGGGKLSGEFAGFGIGALSVVTDRVPGAGRQVLSVARLTRAVFEESQLGFIFTNGDPTGVEENSVFGVDYQYRNSNFLGDRNLQADFYYQRSFTDLVGDDDSFGADINFPNEPWGASASFKQIGENFDPALGFVNRSGIRVYDATVRRLARFSTDHFLRQFGVDAGGYVVTGLDDIVQSRELEAGTSLITQNNHLFELRAINYFERVPELFVLPGDVPVPVGKYEWTNFSASFTTSRFRPISVSGEIICCSFYGGSSLQTSLSTTLQPSRFWGLTASHDWNRLEMPTGDVDIHIASITGTVNFNPDMQLALQAQYDNISESFGLLARYRWEFRPGEELLIAFGQSAIIPNSQVLAQRSQLTIRLGHTMQF